MGDEPCCTPCMVPTMGNDMPKVVVNPCQLPPPNGGCCGKPCCNVCVPLMQPVEPPPVEPRRRKCRYIQPPRPKSYAPNRTFEPPCQPMDDGTVYRYSYVPVEGIKPKPVRPESNLCVGEGKISDKTVNKMSYQPQKILPPCPILPCEHRLIGEGPMQDITTQKHDYVPKPFSKIEKIKPIENLFSSDCPLSDKTTNRLSYMPVKPHHVTPILPVNAIEKAQGKMSDKTINKMSYQPWEPQEQVDMPWARKPTFCPPQLRMSDDTTQKMSYMPPGQYIECDECCPDAVDCPEPKCDPNARLPGCCMPCCCPRAAC